MRDDKGKRDNQRVEFGKAIEANLVAIDGTWRLGCVVLDISAEGAKIVLDGQCPVGKGKEFFLLLSKVGLVYRRCELSWVNGDEIGVHFLTAPKKAA